MPGHSAGEVEEVVEPGVVEVGQVEEEVVLVDDIEEEEDVEEVVVEEEFVVEPGEVPRLGGALLC